jgi:acetyl esterase/lipase
MTPFEVSLQSELDLEQYRFGNEWLFRWRNLNIEGKTVDVDRFDGGRITLGEITFGDQQQSIFWQAIGRYLNGKVHSTFQKWDEETKGYPTMPRVDRAYLRSYSPYENVKQHDYPPILVLCSLNDPRVPYWEGMKWAAHIRATGTNQPEVLVKVRVDGGHQGVSERFEEVDEWALIYAFIICRVSKRTSDPADRGSCAA